MKKLLFLLVILVSCTNKKSELESEKVTTAQRITFAETQLRKSFEEYHQKPDHNNKVSVEVWTQFTEILRKQYDSISRELKKY